MAVSFPSNPSDGDEFVSNSQRWIYDATADIWQKLPILGDVSNLTDTQSLLPAQTLKTQVYNTLGELPTSGPNAQSGQPAFVTSENKLYISTGGNWRAMTLSKQNPVLTSTTDGSGGGSPFTLATDGTVTVITMTASHPDGLPLIYSYNVVAGSLTNGGGTTATIEQGTGAQVNQFFITPSTDAAYNGSFTVEFSVSDGEATEVYVGEFTLAISTEWYITDISTDVTGYDNKSLTVGAQEPGPRAIHFNNDGSEFFVIGSSADDLVQYTCSTPWDISTATHTQSVDLINGTAWFNDVSNPYGFDWKPDGTKVYICGVGNNNLLEGSLSTPWDISTLTATTASTVDLGNLISGSSFPAGLVFKPDGTRAWIQNNLGVNEINFSTPWDISSATFSNVNAGLGNWGQMHFNSDGTQAFVRITTGIRQYAVPTPYSLASINTANYVDWDPIPVSSGNAQSRGFCFHDGTGEKIYTLTSSDVVDQHSVT